MRIGRLQYLIEHGKMDKSELQKTDEDMKRKEKVEQHTLIQK